MYRVLLVILLLLSSLSIQAQKRVIDSLENLLPKMKAGTGRVDLLNKLSYELYDFNDSIGLRYALDGLKEAKALKYEKGIKDAYLLVGLGYFSQCEYSLAIRNFNLSIQSPGKDDNIIYNLCLLGNAYRERAMYDSARYYYQKARTNFSISSEQKFPIYYKNIAILETRLWNNNQAVIYLDSASKILEKQSQPILLDIWATYGVAYQNLLQYDKSAFYFNKLCSKAQKNDDFYHRINCLLNRILTAYKRSDYVVALNHGLEALDLMKLYAYPPQQVELFIRMGETYMELGESSTAGKYFLQALRISEQYGLRYEMGYVYGELGWLYKDQGNYIMALDYVNQSQKIREDIGDRFGLAICHNIRGLIYMLQKKYDLSIAEHNEAKKLRQQINHKEGASSSVFNMSLVFLELNDLDKALSYQFEALRVEETLNNKQNLAITYDFIASIYLKKKDLTKAEYYLEKCRALAEQTKSKLLMRNNTGYFAELYELKGDIKKALQYRKLYQQLNDSVYSEASAAKLAEVQALFQLEKKDREIYLLNSEKELQESKIELQTVGLRQQRLIIVATVGGLILISTFLIFLIRYNRKIKRLNMAVTERNEEIQAQSEELSEANQSLTRLNNEIVGKNEEIQAQSEELMEVNQTVNEINRELEHRVDERTAELRQAYKELDTFFYRASHDFRRPLTTFMGLAEVAKITVKDNNALELFSKVNDTALYLDKMLVKLQSISDLGGQELVYKEIFFKEILDTVSDSYRDHLKERNIKTSFKVDLADPFYSYPALIKIIIENLFENSIFFSRPNNSFINLKAYSRDEVVILEVEDNGEGIPADYHQRVFDMYFRANERSKGNGLGLYIVSKAIEKLKGSISFRSEVSKGTLFTLTFPYKFSDR